MMTQEQAWATHCLLATVDRLEVCRIATSMIRSSHRLFVLVGAELYTYDYEE
jgi:hypothetical protein